MQVPSQHATRRHASEPIAAGHDDSNVLLELISCARVATIQPKEAGCDAGAWCRSAGRGSGTTRRAGASSHPLPRVLEWRRLGTGEIELEAGVIVGVVLVGTWQRRWRLLSLVCARLRSSTTLCCLL